MRPPPLTLTPAQRLSGLTGILSLLAATPVAWGTQPIAGSTRCSPLLAGVSASDSQTQKAFEALVDAWATLITQEVPISESTLAWLDSISGNSSPLELAFHPPENALTVDARESVTALRDYGMAIASADASALSDLADDLRKKARTLIEEQKHRDDTERSGRKKADDSWRVTREWVAHKGAVVSVQFDPDGDRLLTGSQSSTATLWSMNGASLATFHAGGPILEASFDTPPHGTKRIILRERGVSTSWTPWGSFLEEWRTEIATHRFYSLNDTYRLEWRGDTWDLYLYGKSIYFREGPLHHDDPISTAAFAPDSTRMVTGDEAGSIYLWDMKAQPIARRPSTSPSPVRQIEFSPDGSSFLTRTDREVRVWRSGDGSSLAQLRNSEFAFTAARFSADGRAFVTASTKGEVILWSIEGQPLKTFDGGEAASAALSLAVSADGKWIAVGMANGKVHLLPVPY